MPEASNYRAAILHKEISFRVFANCSEMSRNVMGEKRRWRREHEHSSFETLPELSFTAGISLGAFEPYDK